MVDSMRIPSHNTSGSGWLARLNGAGHERALQVYMIIVLAHWAEHLVQAFQIFVLGWARPDSRGVLGQVIPWLASSEVLHYGYAIVMLVGLFVLLPGFTGRARTWWIIALAIQFWHHIEHAVLQWQAFRGENWFGFPMPVSFVQAVFPSMRVELHLFYNTVVFIPMIIGMYLHMFPSAKDRAENPAACTCVRG